ncbi:rhomboid family intramembrane serine protease [Natrialbaceae archaeon GCM10025810]|uniref:rhomboid family intramembrane serine protease n=1 Tax=Halovalidus salilacus TaxID=3075124 RepID=UPI003622921B
MASTRSERSSPILETLALFAVVFVLQQVAAILDVALAASLFVLTPPLTHDPWAVVTSVYAHENLGHLVSNSVALVLFGWPVARATTRLRFHAFFVLTGALAGVSQIALPAALASLPFISAPAVGVLGASGAVFALMGYLLAGNRFSSGLASIVEVPRWLAWLAFLGLAALVTVMTAAPGVALIAHFTGFLLGLLAGRARLLHVGSSPTATRSTA